MSANWRRRHVVALIGYCLGATTTVLSYLGHRARELEDLRRRRELEDLVA